MVLKKQLLKVGRKYALPDCYNQYNGLNTEQFQPYSKDEPKVFQFDTSKAQPGGKAWSYVTRAIIVQ